MSTQVSPRVERTLQRAMDLGERLFLVLLFAIYVESVSHSFVLKPYNVLAVISEALMVLLILIRRDATAVTMSQFDWLVALGGTALPLLVRAGAQPIIPAIVGTVLMFAGLSLAIIAKLTLRRSFGLVAANRGVVGTGPYRLVRHPIYLGYVLVYAGFLLNNPLLWNLAIYVLTVLILVLRVSAEERVLRQDPAYAAFMRRVRYRLAPGLF